MKHRHPDDEAPSIDAHSAVVLDRARREVKAHRAAEAHHGASQQRVWVWISAGLAVVLTLGVLFWPHGTLVERLRQLVRGICDQVNNIPYGAVDLPLDARCTGIYTGLLATFLYLLGKGRQHAAQLPERTITSVLVAAMGVMGVDGLNSVFSQYGYHIYPPHNMLRLVTGLSTGVALTTLGWPLLNDGLRANAHRSQRVVDSWLELLGPVALVLVLGTLAWRGSSWLFYPLAMFSVLGMMMDLFLINTAAVALMSGLKRRILLLGQVARPAAIGLVLTVAQLALLGWTRDSVAQASIAWRALL